MADEGYECPRVPRFLRNAQDFIAEGVEESLSNCDLNDTASNLFLRQTLESSWSWDRHIAVLLDAECLQARSKISISSTDSD